jgi:hypothetical protein
MPRWWCARIYQSIEIASVYLTSILSCLHQINTWALFCNLCRLNKPSRCKFVFAKMIRLWFWRCVGWDYRVEDNRETGGGKDWSEWLAPCRNDDIMYRRATTRWVGVPYSTTTDWMIMIPLSVDATTAIPWSCEMNKSVAEWWVLPSKLTHSLTN